MRRCRSFLVLVGIMASLAVPANALEYAFEASPGPDYGTPTSIEVVHTSDGGARKNEDLSKNAALIPPGFGSYSAYTLNTGAYLTPNIAPGGMAATGSISGGVVITFPTPDSMISSGGSSLSTGHTAVTGDLYYSNGHLGTLRIPDLDLTVKIYQGTGSSALKKGAGHFEETSIWDGNVALAAHNRGVNNHFGQIHTLELGDTLKLTTKLGTRTYEVVSVSKVSETDRSSLADSIENKLTLYTCVRNERDQRWCVQAVEVG